MPENLCFFFCQLSQLIFKTSILSTYASSEKELFSSFSNKLSKKSGLFEKKQVIQALSSRVKLICKW